MNEQKQNIPEKKGIVGNVFKILVAAYALNGFLNWGLYVQNDKKFEQAKKSIPALAQLYETDNVLYRARASRLMLLYRIKELESDCEKDFLTAAVISDCLKQRKAFDQAEVSVLEGKIAEVERKMDVIYSKNPEVNKLRENNMKYRARIFIPFYNPKR